MGDEGEEMKMSKAQRDFLESKPKYPLWNENTPCPSPMVTNIMWRLFHDYAKNPDEWGIAPLNRVSIKKLKGKK